MCVRYVMPNVMCFLQYIGTVACKAINLECGFAYFLVAIGMGYFNAHTCTYEYGIYAQRIVLLYKSTRNNYAACTGWQLTLLTYRYHRMFECCQCLI